MAHICSGLLSILLSFATPVASQNVIDPSTITVNERLVKLFRGNRELLILHYTSKLTNFAVDREKLNLSTLDALLASARNERRANFVRNFFGRDLNWDGVVTREEFNSLFSEDYPLAETSIDPWDQGFRSNDVNGDDMVTIDEIRQMAVEIYHEDRVILKEIEEMRHWDLNGDGFVTQDEVMDVIDANLEK